MRVCKACGIERGLPGDLVKIAEDSAMDRSISAAAVRL